MTDDLALLAAIRAAPDDDAPRLVYADWLDEHGQPERAEFIRVQCELARRDDPALRHREAELLAGHHDTLAGPLAAPHLRFRFERGFVVGFGHTGLFMREVRGPKSGISVRSFVRFHPFQAVLATTTTESAEEVLPWFRQQHAPALRGSYTWAGESFPIAMRLTWPWGFGLIEYTATMKTGSLRLKQDERGGSLYLGTYKHYPIPDFHSFPET